MTMPVGVIEFVEFGDVVKTSWNPPVIFPGILTRRQASCGLVASSSRSKPWLDILAQEEQS